MELRRHEEKERREEVKESGTKGRGSRKTTRGEKLGGDVVVGVGESEGEEKKGESSWNVT